MRGKTYSKKDKEQVKELILQKKSYGEITRTLGVPKSTISVWFGKTAREPWNRTTMINHLINIRKLALNTNKNKWEKRHETENKLIKERARVELSRCPLDSISYYKSILAMLYWAEGAKNLKSSGLKFANTDPLLARLYINLLRICYDIDEKKIRVSLYAHYYHSLKEIKQFWSQNLQVPSEQFNKTYIKKRSKTKRFRKNFIGICFIYYGDTIIRKELLEFGRLLAERTIKLRP